MNILSRREKSGLFAAVEVQAEMGSLGSSMHAPDGGSLGSSMHAPDQAQEGVSVQASCFSSQGRSATHTAEQHLKPEPKASCHTRSPRFTPWKVSM